MRQAAIGVASALLVAVGVIAVHAPADADISQKCATRGEYRQVERGMTPAQVADVVGFWGTDGGQQGRQFFTYYRSCIVMHRDAKVTYLKSHGTLRVTQKQFPPPTRCASASEFSRIRPGMTDDRVLAIVGIRAYIASQHGPHQLRGYQTCASDWHFSAVHFVKADGIWRVTRKEWRSDPPLDP